MKTTTKILLSIAVLAILTSAAVLILRQLPELRARRAAEARLQQQLVYRVLEKHESVVYARVLDKYLAAADGRATQAEFINFANAELGAATTRRLAHASDSAVNALVQDMLTTARGLAGRSADACFRFWFPQVSGPPDVARYVDAHAQSRTLNAMAEVIRSAAETPTPLPEIPAVQDKLAAVVNATYEQFGSDAQMIAHADDPRVDRTKVCAMTIALYERIMAWPPADSSALIRLMTQVN